MRQAITKAALIADLQRVARLLGATPTTREYDEAGIRSPSTVVAHFGSWNAAVEAAGLTVYASGIGPSCSDEELLEEIRRVAKIVGHTPTRDEYAARSGAGMSEGTIRNRFGSWTEAIRLAGYRPRAQGVGGWLTAEEVEADVLCVAKALGRFPTVQEYGKHGKHGFATVYNRCGSFRELRDRLGYPAFPKGVISQATAASRLGVSRQYVEQLVSAGRLPLAGKTGRSGVFERDVERLAAERRCKGRAA